MAKPMEPGSLPLAGALDQLAVGGVALQQVWGLHALPAAFIARAVRPSAGEALGRAEDLSPTGHSARPTLAGPAADARRWARQWELASRPAVAL